MKKLFLLLLIFFTIDSFANGIGNVSSAPCDNDTLNKYTGTANVEINWEPNTIGLNWYDGDTKLTVDNSAQSCVYDGTITVPPAPTKLGYTFNGWKVIPVPGGCKRIEYIESTGRQYIDTGLTTAPGTLEIKVISDVNFPNINNSPETSNGSRCFYISSPNAGLQVYLNGGHIYNQVNLISIQANTDYIIETVTTAKTRDLTINGVYRHDSFSRSITDNAPIYTFGSPNYAGEVDGGIKVKMRNQKFYVNSNLVRDFIPVLDKNNVPCLWDKITGQFFYNAGTGSFVAGPVVQ